MVQNALAGGHFGQSVQIFNASRVSGTVYYNTTGKPIEVHCVATGVSTSAYINIGGVIQVDADTNTGAGGHYSNVSAIVPSGSSYSYNYVATAVLITELR